MSRLYEFVVVASGLDPEDDSFEDRLVGAGCDDATASFQRGLILLDFARRSSDLAMALTSAVADVRRAGATVRAIEPSDLVSLAEIARRGRMTRAAVSNYYSGARGSDFPSPVAHVTTDSPLWSWSEVAQWLHRREQVDEEVLGAAKLIATMNALLASGGDGEARKILSDAAGKVGEESGQVAA